MQNAPRANVALFLSTAIDDPASAVHTLAADGVLRVNSVLSPSTAVALLAHVNAELAARRQAADQRYFARTDTLGANRYDLLIEIPAPPVRAALAELLPRLAPIIGGTLGADATLFELAALVAEPGAARQPSHPDTRHDRSAAVCPDGTAVIVTVFVALQAVEPTMGPTCFVPRTHTADAHARAHAGLESRRALLRESPNHIGTLGVGDANVMDSRTIHCGGANESSTRRVLLVVSFRRGALHSEKLQEVGIYCGSLLDELRVAELCLGSEVDAWCEQLEAAACGGEGGEAKEVPALY